MTTTQTDTTRKFEAVIWEKAEHWTFEHTFRATDEKAARAELLKDYPRRSYSIRSLRSVWG